MNSIEELDSPRPVHKVGNIYFLENIYLMLCSIEPFKVALINLASGLSLNNGVVVIDNLNLNNDEWDRVSYKSKWKLITSTIKLIPNDV